MFRRAVVGALEQPMPEVKSNSAAAVIQKVLNISLHLLKEEYNNEEEYPRLNIKREWINRKNSKKLSLPLQRSNHKCSRKAPRQRIILSY